jgi:HSP20 family protein
MTLLSIARPSALSSVNNRREYSEVLNGFANAFDRYARDSRDIPPVNIIEEPKQFRIQLVAPGFSKNDFKINVEKDQLIISGEPTGETTNEVNYLLNEFSKTQFKRVFTMGKYVDSSKIDASYSNGILNVTLSKKEEAIDKPPRTIAVS